MSKPTWPWKADKSVDRPKRLMALMLKWWLRILSVALLLAATAVFATVWWKIPPLLYGYVVDANAQVKAITDTRTALLAGLVGLGALLTFSLNRKVHRLAEQGHITDRYGKAVEQLGSKRREMRVGGAYALRRIMEDSKRDHGAIVDLLATFLCERAPAPPAGSHAHTPSRGSKVRPDSDVQAALNVLAHRPRRPCAERDRIRLADTDLCGALLRDARLQNVDLRGAWLHDAKLERADLTQASLRGAKLAGADLEDTDLTKADLPDADLRGARNIKVQQLTRALVYKSTKLDTDLAVHPAVKKRIAECELATSQRVVND